jgi:gliding motility-associated-like protein
VATVTVNPAPITTVNSPTICLGSAAILTASGATSYTWSAGATSTGTATASVSPVVTTTYTVTGTSAGCTSTAVATVTVNSSLTVTAGTNATICAGNTASLTATASSGTGGPYTYVWSPTVPASGIVSPAATTTYTVTATDGCSPGATATVTITVFPFPVASFSPDATSGCAPVCVNFTDASTISLGGTINTWNWNFGDGSTDNSANPHHCYSTDGAYPVTLTVTTSDGCSDSIVQNNLINVYPLPEAEFTSNPFVTDITNPTISFSNLSTNAGNYLWTFGDAITSSETNPVHNYGNIGAYSVMLIAASDHGCTDTVVHYIEVNGSYTFYAPNAFTPNDDYTNSTFLPKGTGWNPDKYELMVFDRWGNLCFETRDMNKGWDGKANNGSAVTQQDVYVWKVALTDIFNNSHDYIGSVTVVK